MRRPVVQIIRKHAAAWAAAADADDAAAAAEKELKSHREHQVAITDQPLKLGALLTSGCTQDKLLFFGLPAPSGLGV